MKINDLVKRAHENAKAKGWHDEERTFGDEISLIHSEASEALEDHRGGFSPNEAWYQKKTEEGFTIEKSVQVDETWKPCGIPSELADICIRVFDMCGRYGIDLEKVITEKMAYNATRSHKHGGKVI